MSAANVQNPPGRQRPVDRPVLYWSERQSGWWPGVGRRCPACRGTLYATPPVVATRQGMTPGRVACLLCEREWADVLEVRRANPTPGELMAGEPKPVPLPKPSPVPGRCVRCGGPTLSERRPRCAACVLADARGGTTNANRLLALLRDGRIRQRSEVCDTLAITPESLQKSINALRRRALPVVCDGHGGVVLEGER